MAEFVEVMKYVNRMCEKAMKCTECELSSNDNGFGLPCTKYMQTHPEEAEKIIMEWAAANPGPTYPSWDEAWKQMFPNSHHPEAPCLMFMLPIDHPQVCGVECSECSKRPMPADIAEKFGIKPLEGGNDRG